MQLVLDSEQQQLRSTVRKLLADHNHLRSVVDGDETYDRVLWKHLAGLGLTGLVVPEEHGGAGAGHVERCVVLEELGRALAPVPFFASAVLAADALMALGDTEVLPALASGEKIGALVVSQTWGPSAVTATERDGGWVLDGQASFVISGDVADVFVVYTSDGWFVAEEAQRKTLTTLDPTRGQAKLEFAAAPARRLDAADPAAVLEKVRDLASVALAAEQAGGIAKVLETTVEYAKVRVQFGRAIGSYQAVKHACADLYSTSERVESLLRHAAWVADNAPEELPLAAAAIQVFTAPACFEAARSGLQLHGGIGYTWEHDAHLYYKRAKSSELLFGGQDEQLARLAGCLAEGS
ncbi:acyl-CoA dehydrogenase family protein [Amycolatopsis endophytica]|uniref:Alkylation response protein AidB-like acyl-CoA dehydrogenase n=1 Tax=Amycolatopsis endophytica TaxID=860233 RepID=A0A853BFY4_9PSEU|nr:acyl-CoA dehydrogenase family protein [Amycolatopsis endophytica]NYI93467.1 alkylation response protein AidB-like acyl-CoA dehydrogenase [Amycolatopsis endophytica]